MKKIVIIKYGELTTKKDNINLFISTLRDEVKRALDGLSAEISYDKGRMFIGADDEYYDKIILNFKKYLVFMKLISVIKLMIIR